LSYLRFEYGFLNPKVLTEITPLDRFLLGLCFCPHCVAAAVRAAIPFLGEGGRIITIGSVAGDTTPWAGAADYSATKAAVAAYTRGWARDLGPKGITVNNVQPGPIDTDMNPAANGEFSQTQKTMTALGRYGTAEEVAAAVAFLASPAASYITGANLNVDGGIA